MWHIEKIEKQIKIGNDFIPIDDYSIFNDEGVIFTIVGGGRERQEDFLYEDRTHNIEFKFTATRYDSSGKVLKDNYLVFLSSALQFPKIKEEWRNLSEIEVKKIKENIREVLLLWPRGATQTTIRDVTFQ